MKILQIIPGSGGSFYCGNCLRDSKFYSSLKKLDHDVVKIPMYLPLFDDKHAMNGEVPVFYGAVSMYLKQNFPIFRKFPAWFHKALDSGPMLRLASKFAGSTRAEGLEDMTVSMLLGEDGNQNEELEHMAQWIENHFKPDVIHISNALLLGLVHRLKKIPGVKIVCSLQDEDVWVETMHESYRDKSWKLMGEKAREVDLFISVSDYFAKYSMEKMDLPPENIKTIPLGVDPDDYRFVNAAEKKRNIGFISRECYGNGMDILVDAFVLLKQKPEFKDVKLIITGGYTGDDKKFRHKQKEKIRKNNLQSYVEFQSDFDGEDRLDFFDNISVMSVPVRGGEAFGIYLTEAMASGIPVVQPAVGAFTEIVEKSGGGLLYEPNKPQVLADKLAVLLTQKQMLSDLSIAARKASLDIYNINQLAEDMIEAYAEMQ
jgi:glycosyltransferase involved in cell wall biosynthesis